jgi:hypothetical protein
MIFELESLCKFWKGIFLKPITLIFNLGPEFVSAQAKSDFYSSLSLFLA